MTKYFRFLNILIIHQFGHEKSIVFIKLKRNNNIRSMMFRSFYSIAITLNLKVLRPRLKSCQEIPSYYITIFTNCSCDVTTWRLNGWTLKHCTTAAIGSRQYLAVVALFFKISYLFCLYLILTLTFVSDFYRLVYSFSVRKFNGCLA
jgi:hypothetical protein